MQPALDFLATHRFVLWILLAYGVWCSLLTTVLYRPAMYFYFRTYRRYRDNLEGWPRFQQKGIKKLIRWTRKHYRAWWAWLPGFLFGLAVIGGAIAGLILL